jgi:hypothetical protein
MQQTGHGKVGVGYVAQIMIIGVAGPVFCQLALIQVNDVLKNSLKMFNVVSWIDKPDYVKDLLMDHFR